jgi:hypothetical protein
VKNKNKKLNMREIKDKTIQKENVGSVRNMWM